ncbi:MAG TPA: cytochrome c biogenesis protein CcdA [Gaiellales bacterium]|jgi:cytochrome c-type biogenesis protein
MREAAVAFSAGLLSFATPCVLPLVPAYLGAIGARSTDPRRAFLASLPFVVGFSLVFIALGAGAGLAGATLTDHRAQLIKLSGIVIVAMGLVMLGLIRVPGLERSFAPGIEGARASGSALLLGGAFGLAWTPCIGPVLGSILALAATGATAARGAGLLAAYAAGLAVPFLVAGVALGRVMSAARVVRDRYGLVRIVSGGVLIAAGLLVFFDKTYLVNSWVGQFTS